LVSTRSVATVANPTIDSSSQNRAMLSTETNAAVNTRRAPKSNVTFAPAARDMHFTVHRVERRNTNDAGNVV
jgi:hypothetical protein